MIITIGSSYSNYKRGNLAWVKVHRQFAYYGRHSDLSNVQTNEERQLNMTVPRRISRGPIRIRGLVLDYTIRSAVISV